MEEPPLREGGGKRRGGGGAIPQNENPGYGLALTEGVYRDATLLDVELCRYKRALSIKRIIRLGENTRILTYFVIRVYFRPLKKGVMLPLAIVKMG